ncbi:MAG: D-alanine--D-alanine ligase [Desulfamplus sp.]|nr:D-alanine--D-alanine ligase [Desulfamplus sp.]
MAVKIAIVHNAVKDNSLPDELDVIKQAKAVAISLANLGHTSSFVPCDLNLDALKHQLARIKPDIVFNLVESLDGHGRLIHVVPSLLDALKIPYTGACAEAIYHTSHKVMAKERMRAAGLPTPEWVNPFPYDLPWIGGMHSAIAEPVIHNLKVTENESEKIWIIKSLWEHASFGIDENNVVAGTREIIAGVLEERASELGGSCFAEAFIDGREFNISLLGNGKKVQIMPPAEIIFKDNESNSPRILGYKAKWIEDANEYKDTPRSFDFPEKDGELLHLLKKLAIRCWHLFNLGGYARVDFRVDHNKKPMILEINANPCISPDAGFAAAVEKGGISYDAAIEHILNDTHR